LIQLAFKLSRAGINSLSDNSFSPLNEIGENQNNYGGLRLLRLSYLHELNTCAFVEQTLIKMTREGIHEKHQPG
jgi:hypothetical protein